MTQNKINGTRYEKEVAQILYDNGYWVTLLTASHSGQPADLIAIRGKQFALIDCKLCSHDIFEMSRIEPNQIRSMRMLEKRSGYAVTAFVLGMSTGNYVVSWEEMERLLNENVRSFNKKYCEKFITLEEWAK